MNCLNVALLFQLQPNPDTVCTAEDILVFPHSDQMARPASTPFYTYFKITYPLEYVAHIEINRADRLNAFIEP